MTEPTRIPADTRALLTELGPGDAVDIAEITRKAFGKPYCAVPGVPPPSAASETEETVVGDLRTGTRVWLLRLPDGEPLSILRTMPEGQEAWLIRRFGVLPEHRGRGYGALILSLIEVKAKEAGVRRLSLYCVVERLLVPYYQRLGFHVTKIAPHEEKPLTIATMEKRLDCGHPERRELTPAWEALPPSGLYLLWLYLPTAQVIPVGKLREWDFEQGLYVYIGSALRRSERIAAPEDGIKGTPLTGGVSGIDPLGGGKPRQLLNHRLSRHWAGPAKPHWHVDWLRKEAIPVGIDILPFPAASPAAPKQDLPSECQLALRLSAYPEVKRPLYRFGSSDCGCEGHLFRVNGNSPIFGLPRSFDRRLLCFYRCRLPEA